VPDDIRVSALPAAGKDVLLAKVRLLGVPAFMGGRGHAVGVAKILYRRSFSRLESRFSKFSAGKHPLTRSST